MKRLLLLIGAILVLSYIGHAQGGTYFSTVPGNGGEKQPFLNKGDNILGLGTRLSGQLGKNKFDNADNTRKPSEIDLSYDINYERMINDRLAIGAFINNEYEIQKNKEADTRFVQNQLLAGPMLTCYKPCGEAQNGGMFSMLTTGAGFEYNSFSSGGDKQKDPIHPVVTGQVDVGGYYLPTPSIMLFTSIAAFGFTTVFMNMDESGSIPDMTETDFKFGIKDMNLRIGARWIIGNDAPLTY